MEPEEILLPKFVEMRAALDVLEDLLIDELSACITLAKNGEYDRVIARLESMLRSIETESGG